MRLEVVHERQDHRLVLVVAREAQRREVRQTADVMDEAVDVTVHLERRLPVLEREHRAPVQPEVRIEHFVVEVVGNLLVRKLLLSRQIELEDLHDGLVGEAELLVRVRVLSTALRGAALRIVRVLLVEPVVVVEHGDVLVLDARHITVDVPHDLEMVVHLAATAHHIAFALDERAVKRAARQHVLFEHMDVLARHLRIAHQIERGRERRKPRADDVCALALDALRFAGVCEGLEIACRIIHGSSSCAGSFPRRSACAVFRRPRAHCVPTSVWAVRDFTKSLGLRLAYRLVKYRDGWRQRRKEPHIGCGARLC